MSTFGFWLVYIWYAEKVFVYIWYAEKVFVYIWFAEASRVMRISNLKNVFVYIWYAENVFVYIWYAENVFVYIWFAGHTRRPNVDILGAMRLGGFILLINPSIYVDFYLF